MNESINKMGENNVIYTLLSFRNSVTLFGSSQVGLGYYGEGEEDFRNFSRMGWGK